MRSPRTHALKTWPKCFGLMWTRRKCFEYRKNDRDFQVGDVLALQEWDPDSKKYTGVQYRCIVTLLITECPGLPEGYCIMQVDDVPPGADFPPSVPGCPQI